MVWYSHLLKNFPQFIVIHTVKGFGIVNKTETDVFLELSCFFYDPADVAYNHITSIQNENILKIKIQQIMTASNPLHCQLGFSEIRTKFHMLFRNPFFFPKCIYET